MSVLLLEFIKMFFYILKSLVIFYFKKRHLFLSCCFFYVGQLLYCLTSLAPIQIVGLGQDNRFLFFMQVIHISRHYKAFNFICRLAPRQTADGCCWAPRLAYAAKQTPAWGSFRSFRPRRCQFIRRTASERSDGRRLDIFLFPLAAGMAPFCLKSNKAIKETSLLARHGIVFEGRGLGG